MPFPTLRRTITMLCHYMLVHTYTLCHLRTGCLFILQVLSVRVRLLIPYPEQICQQLRHGDL